MKAEIALIYALLDPETGKPRYIGHTRDAQARLEIHWDSRTRKARFATNPRFYGWLRSLSAPPECRVLAQVPRRDRFWLERLFTERARHALGDDLLNINSGNRMTADRLAEFMTLGIAARDQATQARAAARAKQPPRPKVRRRPGPMTAERRANISRAKRGWNPSAETRAKMSAGQKVRFARTPQIAFYEGADEQILEAVAATFGGTVPSLRTLQRTFGVGQKRAQRLQKRLQGAA